MNYTITDAEQFETIAALRSRIDRLTAAIEEGRLRAADTHSSEAYRDAWADDAINNVVRLRACEQAYRKLGGKLHAYMGATG